MKINWRERLKNKTIVITFSALILTFTYQLLAMLDIVPRVSQDTATEFMGMMVNLLAMLGVIVDPTTEGINDSDRAMTYGTEEDVRNG